MWFRTILLGYCAASSTVTIATASIAKDATVPRRQHIVERLVFPLLERRQPSFVNLTSLSETVESTSSVAASSGLSESTKLSQPSTIINTPSIVITSGPTSSSIPTPTPSTIQLGSASIQSNSGNKDDPSISVLVSTESVKPSTNFATEEESSKTSVPYSPNPSQDATSERATSSTIVDTTFFVMSSSDGVQSSSIMAIPSSIPTSTSDQTFTTSSEVIASSEITHTSSPITTTIPPSTSTPTFDQTSTISPETTSFSDTTQIPSPTSISVSGEGTSHTPSDPISSSASEIAAFNSTTETGLSTVPISTSQMFVPETSSTLVGTLIELTSEPVFASSTLVKQQPSALSSSSPISSSDQGPSSAIPEPVAPTASATSITLPQESLTTNVGQASVSTSLPALPSPGSQISSSSEEGKVFTPAPQTRTVAAPSSELISTSAQTTTVSEVAPSSSVSSAIEPSPNSTIEILTSAIETLQPPSSTGSLEITIILTPSAIQQSLSSSSERSLTSSVAEHTPLISDVLSSLVATVVPSGQSSVDTSSLQPTISSSERLLSSPSSEPSSIFSEASSTLDFPVSRSGPAISTDPTSQVESSFSAAPTSSSLVGSTQTGPLLSGTDRPTPSVPDVSSTELASFTSTGSSLVATPSPTVIENGTSIATPSVPASTDPSSSAELHVPSIGTSVLSSATSESEVISSFIPSETLYASAVISTTSSLGTSIKISQASSSPTFTFFGTQPGFSQQPSSATSSLQQSSLSVVSASALQATKSQTSSILEPAFTNAASLSVPSSSASLSSSLVVGSQIISSHNPTSVVPPSLNTTTGGSIPTLESSSGLSFIPSFSRLSSLGTLAPSGMSSFAASDASTGTRLSEAPLPSPVVSNGNQTGSVVPITWGTVTATFSTVFVSSFKSSVLDPSTVAFSLFSTVTGLVVNQTDLRTSSARSTTTRSETSGPQVPASESLQSSSRPGLSANLTWSSPTQSSLSATTGLPGRVNGTNTGTAELGITFTRSALPTGASIGTTPSLDVTEVETLQTSSVQDAVNSTIAGFAASTTSDNVSSARTDKSSSTSASRSDEASTTNDISSESTKIFAAPHTPTSTSSQTAAAGNPPPLTTSQTAGVAVGATTGLLVAVVAAVFIARRYHAAKHGKRMSTGSVYPKVAYLYDPRTGGNGGDAEAPMSGATGGMPPGGPASRAAQGSPKHLQRHSTGAMPIDRFTSPGNPFRKSVRDPAVHRYSDHAHIDTARALSAAVAGYGGDRRHSSSYMKYPSDVTNPFSNHVIPSPTFAPFSPDDIRRPELPTPHSVGDGRGEYSQMSVSPYAYLNTAASMYPPVSPYGRSPTHGPSPIYDTRRQTIDSDPFADPFEHDLILQVDERNRTSDSVTIFAPSPNLVSPRTPRTPVGPKLPVRQPNGMTSTRSLLSPVAAKYMHKAQEVKIPRKSVASPVLVQVGRSPVIKPFSPPPAAPEPVGWEDIKRHSEKRFSDEQSVPAPLKFKSAVIKTKPAPSSHTRMKPSLTGAGQALLAGNGLPLTVKIPHMYNKSVGLHVPRVHDRPDPAHEDVSSDPVVREKRSRELRFADPALIGKEF